MSAHDLVRRMSLAARGLRARWPLRSAQRVGSGARLLGSPWIENHGTLEIGDEFTLSSEPVMSHIVVGHHAHVVFGHRVSIGHGAGIAADARIEIDDEVTLGPMVMIMDTDFHDVASMSAPGKTSPVKIERGARIGEASVLLKGTHVGAGAVVAPGSVVSGTVAPGSHVAGVPARVVRPRAHGEATFERAELVERVPRLVAETFHVPRSVTLDDGPGTLPGWDSLGVLRLLVTLEDELGSPVDAERLAAARSVADVIALLA